MIDYRCHDPLYEYLLQEHSDSRFDAIVDTIGIQSLYSHCPGYLRDNGRFINIGAMQLKTSIVCLLALLWSQFLNAYWPACLGGTPRWFRFLSGTPDLESLSRVKHLAEHGILKPVSDSTWRMEDALKVCCVPLVEMWCGCVMLMAHVPRRMTESFPNARKGKS